MTTTTHYAVESKLKGDDARWYRREDANDYLDVEDAVYDARQREALWGCNGSPFEYRVVQVVTTTTVAVACPAEYVAV